MNDLIMDSTKPRVRARSPHWPHDFELLAYIAANPHMTLGEIADRFVSLRQVEFEALQKGRSGRAFIQWFNRQPKEFKDAFRIPGRPSAAKTKSADDRPGQPQATGPGAAVGAEAGSEGSPVRGSDKPHPSPEPED